MSIVTRHRTTFVVATVAVLCVLGGTAFAYFTATNGGSGTVPISSASPWVLTSQPIAGLSPTSPPVHILGTGRNALGQREYIGTVTPTVVSTSNAGCTSADFTVTPGVINADEASGATNLNFGTISFHDTSSNQNACEGVTVNLSYTSD